MGVGQDDWYPETRVGVVAAHLLRPGQLVIYERKPWRVRRVRDLPQSQWPSLHMEEYGRYRRGVARMWGAPDTPDDWAGRPVVVSVAPDKVMGGDGRSLVSRRDHPWDLLSEHYSVCNRCGDLPPCADVQADRSHLVEEARMRQVMSLLPGYCMACGGPVVDQLVVSFPGGNLLRPDFGEGTAVFHRRYGCMGRAQEYDVLWSQQTGRRRRLWCAGTLTVHATGEMDCGLGDVCRGLDVAHADRVWHHRDARAGSGDRECWCVKGKVMA